VTLLARIGVAALIVRLIAFEGASPTAAEDPRDILVSLIQLIANPMAFDQKRVLVKGYAVLEFESQHLYLSETDAKHLITRNSVWLDVGDAIKANPTRFNRRYVLVEGTFNARRRGHLSLSSGEIENIGRFQVSE